MQRIVGAVNNGSRLHLSNASVFSLLIFLFLFSGCKPPVGGGGSVHIPPKYIESGKPTKLELELSVRGAGSQDVTRRYEKVTCHFRITGQSKLTDLPMNVSQAMKSKAIYECLLPALSEKDGNSVEYYFDMYLDGHYNKRPEEVVPIKDTAHDPNY
ncbi:MAG: hypothetical protein ABSG97_08010 [Sedimentisphaerales bacterium]|jgi:hypothetical protein